MYKAFKILSHQGRQYIKDIRNAVLSKPFRGRPIISNVKVNPDKMLNICPFDAISVEPVSIDLGRCGFCGECAFAYPEKFSFTRDYKLSTNDRSKLIITEGENKPIEFNYSAIDKNIQKLFGSSFKLRQVSAAGDNSAEMELNAAGNVNFDIGRFGISFVASPRHADGIVITGPVSENMAEPLKICYEAVPAPKVVILCGVDAISGGLFKNSPAINREFIDNIKVDLYIPGNPPHPLTVINGILDFLGRN